MRAALITFFLHVFAKLPLGCNRLLGSLAGRIAYCCNTNSTRIAARNLQLCFPDQSTAERNQLVQSSLISTFQFIFETSSIWFRGAQWRKTHTLSIHNEALFQRARESGRGILILVPHFGNWELAGIHVSEWVKGSAIYRPPKIEQLDPLFRKARNVGTSTLVPPTAKGVMAILKALKRGEMTVILPDQVPMGEGGVFASFFGMPAFTVTLIYKLIQKTNPVVLQAYAIRRQQGFELGFMEPHPSIYSDNQQESVAGLNKTVEMLVALAPEQYLWEYKRFKKQPGDVSHYAKR